MNERAYGLAYGLAYGGFMALLAWGAALFHTGEPAIEETAKYYPGYRASLLGGLIGALYGLVTGYALGWVIARVYNSLRRGVPMPRRIEAPIV